jgi:hypothetical protein
VLVVQISLGRQAGYSATSAYNSNFLGDNAGFQATNADSSNFFGQLAGSKQQMLVVQISLYYCWYKRNKCFSLKFLWVPSW